MDPDREVEQAKRELDKKMGIGTLDKMFDVLTGKQLDYSEIDEAAKPEDHYISGGEKEGDGLLNLSMQVLGDEVEKTIKTASVQDKTLIDPTGFHINAIQKYPSLIETLGKEGSNELAEKIGEVLNSYIVEKIYKNSSSINKFVVECKAEDGNIKQYFKYENRVGFVKVAGKFCGDEYIHYDYKRNEALVLKKKEEDKFLNISNEFEIESEFMEEK